MSKIPCPVGTCARQMPGTATVCGACTGDLARALGDIPFLSAHLRTALTRQARIETETTTTRIADGDDDGRQWPGTLRPTPVLYDQRASDAAANLRNTVTTWTRVLLDANPLPPRPPGPHCQVCGHPSCDRIRAGIPPAGDTASCSRWLLRRLAHLQRHPAAVEIVEDILHAVRLAEAAVDRPPEAWYAGPCEQCGTDLYAEPGAAFVHCAGDGCTGVYGVTRLRDRLLAAAEDHLATATLAARALTSLGEPCTPERIRKWAERSRIVAHGVSPAGHPQYRIGDVRALLVEAEQRKAEREKVAS